MWHDSNGCVNLLLERRPENTADTDLSVLTRIDIDSFFFLNIQHLQVSIDFIDIARLYNVTKRASDQVMFVSFISLSLTENPAWSLAKTLTVEFR